MTVWFAIPSAAPVWQASECIRAWRDMGYRIAAAFEDDRNLPVHLAVCQDRYPGYAASVNDLAARILARDPGCRVVVTGGDDTYPDRNKSADAIEAEFVEHFGGTLGVMQPIGHSAWSPLSGTVAWSPWLGRQWCERAYMGRGPLWPGYFHFYVDLELQIVADQLSLFRQRPDLCHFHKTWKLPPEDERVRPPHLVKAKAMERKDADMFAERQAWGFPLSELLPP